jgi:hypothetical protein
VKYSRAESGAERGIAEAAETWGNWVPAQNADNFHASAQPSPPQFVLSPDDSASVLHDMTAGGEEDVFTYEHVDRDTLSSEAETAEDLADEDTYSASESDEDGS